MEVFKMKGLRKSKFHSATGPGICIIAFIAFSIVLLTYCSSVFSEYELCRNLALTRNSSSSELFLKNSRRRYIEFYFWNWTNPKYLVGKHQAKPNFVEFGPYVFTEKRIKVGPNDESPSGIKWNDNGTVTFRQMRTWHFEPSLSNGSLDDEIVTLNIPAATIAFASRKFPDVLKTVLDNAMAFSVDGVHIKRKVREFLFEGYDPLFDLESYVPSVFLPKALPFDKFGWFYKRNNSASYDGVFNMKTGVDDIQNLGVLANWNYENRTSYYESNCGMVNGSAGELFPPKRDKSSISVFSPEICRTINLNFKEEVEVNGTKGYRYWGDESMFADQTVKQENLCWCSANYDPRCPSIQTDIWLNPIQTEKCPPHGALDVSACKWGTPAYISFPHYLHADPYYTDAIEGMKPDPEKHQTFVDLEPVTGATLNVTASFQINFLLEKIHGFFLGFELWGNVPSVYIPFLWFKQNSF